MTLNDFFVKCGEFMLTHGGTTYDIFNHVTKDEKKPLSSVFFSPYRSSSDFFYRGGSVFFAPVFLSILSIELAAVSFYLSLTSIYKLATLDLPAAKLRLQDTVVHFVASVAAAVAAFLSPFVNFVDFVGAAVTSMLPKKDEEGARPVMP